VPAVLSLFASSLDWGCQKQVLKAVFLIEVGSFQVHYLRL
jgi:hypothetical protein